MKKIIFSCLFFFGIGNLFCQSLSPVIISPVGNYYESEDFNLSWTLGENFIRSMEGDAGGLTQGFHQPNYLLVSLHENLITDYHIKIFPNPLVESLQITGDLKKDEKVSIQLVNLQGHIFKTWEKEKLPFQTSVKNLPSGIYFLSVFLQKNKKVFKTFSLTKI